MTDPRLQDLYEMLERTALDAISFVPGPNFFRLFDRDFHLMERPLVVIVPREATPVAIVPSLEMASFAEINFPGDIFDWRDENGYEAAFATAALNLSGLRTVGLEAQRMRVFEQMALARVFPETTFVDAHAELSAIRLIKTDTEIARLKRAIEISEAALETTLAQVATGMTEVEVQSILMRELFTQGAEGLAFDPIVAAGDNSAQPHAHARPDYEIKTGDALLFDFGAKYQNMNADITRTFFVGEVSDFDRAFYETVLAANARGRAITRAGETAHGVDDAVQSVLEQTQFAEFIRHKTGHGLGLDVHEAPQIMRGNHSKLETGMIFTVEPGLYRDGECGVRIEDDIVVTKDGHLCLTSFPRELRVIGKTRQ